MSLLHKQSLGGASLIRVFGTLASMQAAIDDGALANGDMAFVRSENATYYVKSGTAHQVTSAQIGVSTSSELPAGATATDFAVDRTGKDVYQFGDAAWQLRVTKRSVLAALRETYSPLILLGFDERAGSVAQDSSGNGYDFDLLGNAQLESYLTIPDDGASKDAAHIAVYPAFSGDLSIVFDFERIGGTSTGYIYSVGTNRPVFFYSSNTLKFSQGATGVDSARIFAIGRRATLAVSVDDAASQIHFYENGLNFFSTTFAATPANTGLEGSISHISTTTTTGQAPGKYRLFQHMNSALTEAQQYDIAQKAGAVPDEGHYFREKIRNDLCVHQVCAAHHPLWEKTGTQAIDVSGKGNHGTYVSSPTLGQNPITEGFLRSVGGSTGNLTLTTVIDVATADFTVAGFADPATANLQGLVVLGAAGNYIGLWYNAGNLTLEANGTGTGQLINTAQPVQAFGWCVRRTGTIVEFWIDGVSQGTIDISGLTIASSTTHKVKDWGHDGIGTWQKRVNHHGTFPAALDGTICAALSTGTVTPSFAPAEGHYFTEVIEDELGIADSCVAFHPTWETAGTQAIDVSGSGNHGTYVGSPTLGQPALSEGFLHSIGGINGRITIPTLIDIATDDFTFAGTAGNHSTGNGGLRVIGDAGSYIGIAVVSSTSLQIRAYDGGAGAAFAQITEPSGSYGYCLRRIGNTLSWWIDGVKQADVDISAQSLVSKTTHQYGYWGFVAVGGWDGNIQDHGTFNIAHTDAVCARLSETTI